MRAQRTERGQVLIIIVLVVVGMMGFAALAIDGGRVYAERRRAQNAVDAAAYKIAFEHVSDNTLTEAELKDIAQDLVIENGFIPSTTPGTPYVVLDVHYPPASGVYAGDKEYYQVFLTARVPQSFSYFIFNGGLPELKVEAVAQAQPIEALFPGDAMVATNTEACSAMEFSGTGKTTVTGGNVFSNSVAKAGVSIPSNPGSTFSNNCNAGVRNGSGGVKVVNGDINVAGAWRDNGGSESLVQATVNQAPSVKSKPLPFVPVPNCSHLTNRGDYKKTGGGNETIYPGIYSSIDVQGGTVTMESGMYCLNGDFEVGGSGSLVSKVGKNDGVFIVMLQGSAKFNGSGAVTLKRLNSVTDASGEKFGGMLIYMPMGNQGTLQFGGGSGSNYVGTIYAPDVSGSQNTAKCELTGNSGTVALSSSVSCNTIKVSGGANVNIIYNPEQNYQKSPKITLSQ